jgi:hemolysin activation/secretion protein
MMKSLVNPDCRRSRRALRQTVLGTGCVLLLVPVVVTQAAPLPPARPLPDTGVVLGSQTSANQNTPAAHHGGRRATPLRRPELRSTMPKAQTSLSGLHLSMQGFRIEGNVKVSEEGLKGAMAPWLDRELSFPEFEQAVHAVADYLRTNGHPKVQVRISRAMMKEGHMAVAIEGLTPRSADYAEVPVVEPRIQVNRFEVSGASLLDADEIRAAVAPWEGRELTVAEMQQPAEAIAGLIRAKGYSLAQAFLPPQRVDGGTLEIRVQEGVVDGSAGINGIVTSGAEKRIKPEVLAKVLAAGAPAGQPLKAEALEQSLLVANDLPGIKKVKANLAPGSQPGTTQVEAEVEEGRLFSGSVWADNYGNRYTGEARLNVAANLNSPSGHGEQWSLTGSRSSGMTSGRFGLTVPVGVRGGRLGASYSEVTMDFSGQSIPVNLDGRARVASIFGSYPLHRSATSSVFLSGSYDSKHLIHNVEGSTDSDRQIDLFTAGLVGDGLDRFGGTYNWGLSLATGNVDLSGNAGNALRDSISAATDGHFTKTNYSLARLAPIGAAGSPWNWYASLSGQFASKNLDSAEKFQLGGPNGVRAYPVGEAFGDSGYLASLEIRRSLGETALGEATLLGFFDIGGITQYHDTWSGWSAGDRPNSYTLKGAGFGASLVKTDKGSLKAFVAKKIGSNPNPTITNTDSDGTDKSARIWIMGTISF